MKKKRAKKNGKGIAGRRLIVSDADLVKAWCKAESVAAVADAIGMTYSGIQARARLLRDAGVKLPKFARPKRHVDVAALNALLKAR